MYSTFLAKAIAPKGWPKLIERSYYFGSVAQHYNYDSYLCQIKEQLELEDTTHGYHVQKAIRIQIDSSLDARLNRSTFNVDPPAAELR